jgi:two-component system response regulator NreC
MRKAFMQRPIRVVLADDHSLMRKGLRAVLEAEPDIRVVAEATNSTEAVVACQRHAPDVAAVDLGPPATDGLSIMWQVTSLGLPTQTLGMSMLAEREMLLTVLATGGSGFVIKHAADSQLADAVRTADRGQVYLYPSGVRLLLERYFQVVEEPEGWGHARPGLSEREAEVLRLTAEGYSNVAIASRFSSSPRTVEVHQRRIVEKLGLDQRSELLRYAGNRGMLDTGQADTGNTTTG